MTPETTSYGVLRTALFYDEEELLLKAASEDHVLTCAFRFWDIPLWLKLDFLNQLACWAARLHSFFYFSPLISAQ